MYYDLNILWPPQFRVAGPSTESPSKKSKKDARLVPGTPNQKQSDPLKGLSSIQREQMRAMTVDVGELGYNVVAFNHIIKGKFDPARHTNPFISSQPPFPDLDPRCTDLSQGDLKVIQLSRMTLLLNESSMGKGGHGMISPSTSALLTYDLLAAQAFNDASFSLLCLTMSELKPGSIDIISLDLSTSARLPFFLKRSTVNAAMANGVVFEICYSNVVKRGDEDEKSHARTRRNVISAARDILRVTNGKNVIFSSGTADILGLRGPNDVINLATIFGLNQAAAKDAISSTCRSLLMRAETRKTFRAVVSHPTVAVTTIGEALPEPILIPELKGKRKQVEAALDPPTKKAKTATV